MVREGTVHVPGYFFLYNKGELGFIGASIEPTAVYDSHQWTASSFQVPYGTVVENVATAVWSDDDDDSESESDSDDDGDDDDDSESESESDGDDDGDDDEDEADEPSCTYGLWYTDGHGAIHQYRCSGNSWGMTPSKTWIYDGILQTSSGTAAEPGISLPGPFNVTVLTQRTLNLKDNSEIDHYTAKITAEDGTIVTTSDFGLNATISS